MSDGARMNVPLLLRAVHAIEVQKLGVGEVCDHLGIDPATFYRLRRNADALLGVQFDQHDGGTLYVKDFGLLSASRARRAAASLARSIEPGAWRRGINRRGAT